jgi:hypothetical protein
MIKDIKESIEFQQKRIQDSLRHRNSPEMQQTIQDVLLLQNILHYYIENVATEAIVDTLINKVDWRDENLYKKIDMHPDFLDIFWPYINQIYACKHQTLPPFLMDRVSGSMNWYRIVSFQDLPDETIRQFDKEISNSECWGALVRYQPLSEEILEEYANAFNWLDVLEYQPLSREFFDKHKSRIFFAMEVIGVKGNDPFFWNKWITPYILQDERRIRYSPLNFSPEREAELQRIYDLCFEKLHRQKSHEEKLAEMRAYAEKHGFVMKDDILYCYRQHTPEGRGLSHQRIKYKLGVYYRDWHCDLRPESYITFGFGLDPKGNVLVTVKAEDWGTECTHKEEEGCARVWGFTVVDTKQPASAY